MFIKNKGWRRLWLAISGLCFLITATIEFLYFGSFVNWPESPSAYQRPSAQEYRIYLIENLVGLYAQSDPEFEKTKIPPGYCESKQRNTIYSCDEHRERREIYIERKRQELGFDAYNAEDVILKLAKQLMPAKLNEIDALAKDAISEWDRNESAKKENFSIRVSQYHGAVFAALGRLLILLLVALLPAFTLHVVATVFVWVVDGFRQEKT